MNFSLPPCLSTRSLRLEHHGRISTTSEMRAVPFPLSKRAGVLEFAVDFERVVRAVLEADCGNYNLGWGVFDKSPAAIASVVASVVASQITLVFHMHARYAGLLGNSSFALPATWKSRKFQIIESGAGDPPASSMKPKPDFSEAARQVREIYAEWGRRPIDRNCTGIADCCRFRLIGHTPFLTKGEALVAAKAWRAAGRKDVVVPADGSCPFLHPESGKCRIYDGRPFGCRTHFCPAAGGPAHRNDVRDLIQRLEEIDHRLGGNGAVNLPTAVRGAMAWAK